MKPTKFLILVIVVLISSCDSTKQMDKPQPNHSPYTPITITQNGDILTVNTTADKFYWYDWDAHLKRLENGMSNEQSLRQPNEWTTDNRVTWTKKCRVRVGCMKNGNVSWSDIKYVH